MVQNISFKAGESIFIKNQETELQLPFFIRSEVIKVIDNESFVIENKEDIYISNKLDNLIVNKNDQNFCFNILFFKKNIFLIEVNSEFSSLKTREARKVFCRNEAVCNLDGHKFYLSDISPNGVGIYSYEKSAIEYLKGLKSDEVTVSSFFKSDEDFQIVYKMNHTDPHGNAYIKAGLYSKSGKNLWENLK